MFILEQNVDKLANNSDTIPSKKYRSDNATKVQISNLIYNQVDNDKLLIKCRASSSSGNPYNTQILVQGVRIVSSDVPGSLDILHTNNIMPIPKQTECEYHCTCLDFRWTFAYYNSVSSNLLGSPPPPYQPTTNKGPRNPGRVPGLCKHLLKLLAVLEQEGIIV